MPVKLYPTGKELFDAVSSGEVDLDRLAEEIRFHLSNLKVKAKLRHISSTQIAPSAFQTALLNVNCGGDPDKLWRFWHSRSKINLTSYYNREVNELLDWGRSVVSMGKELDD